MKEKLSIQKMQELAFSRSLDRRTNATHYYTVKKPITVSWPDDTSLVNYCDGCGGMNFGGYVTILSDEFAKVDVYVE